MNYHALTSGEKARLVMTILESIDGPIEFDEFQETVGLLCEDIPGLEGVTENFLSALVTDCWEIYSVKTVASFGK
jgi:hypothetical protein